MIMITLPINKEWLGDSEAGVEGMISHIINVCGVIIFREADDILFSNPETGHENK